MGVGTISVNKLFTERIELTPRTSDPTSEEGEAWVRSDLAPETDQLATLRVDTGGSTIDVPLFAVGTSQDGVVESLRLQVGASTAYVPALPVSDAGYPALRLQHNGQVYGFHDATGATAFFDMAITATNSPVDEGQTLTVDYSVSNTGSISGTQDIRLDVGSTERDRNSGVTVASGGSTTGQLSWSSTTQGSYTATVASDDDSASTSVNIETAAIPDSVVAQFNPATFTTGDSVWSDDVGSSDMSLNGDLQKVSLSNGNGGIKSDGTDDYGLFTFPISGSNLNSYAIEFVYQTTTTNKKEMIAALNGDGQRIRFQLNINENNSTESGNIKFYVEDTNGNVADASPNRTDLNDGTARNIILNVNDASNGDIGIVINSANQTLNFNRQQNLTSFGSWTHDMAVWGRNNDGSIDQTVAASIGKIRIHDSQQLSSTI